MRVLDCGSYDAMESVELLRAHLPAEVPFGALRDVLAAGNGDVEAVVRLPGGQIGVWTLRDGARLALYRPETASFASVGHWRQGESVQPEVTL